MTKVFGFSVFTVFFLGLLFLGLLNGVIEKVEGSSILGDPYEILGTTRGASTKEIRRAYKQLAVIWHPDKNKEPEAEERFILINRAYELLSDPARRRLYDQRGITEDSPNLNPRPDYSSFNRFDPIDEVLTFTTGGAFHYPFADGIAFLHKQSITAKTFDQTTLPRSFTMPQLILFYGDWCSGCARVASIWRTISDQLTSVGMDVSCVHADRETAVARKIGIKVIPSVVLLLDSHPYHYRDSAIAPNKIIAFIRSKLPYDLLVPLDKDNVEDFLGSWWDNRVRVIIFGTTPIVRLRYQLLAFHFRERAAFGYVTNEDPDFALFQERFGVPDGLDSLLVFKELEKPVASLSMTEIPQKLMNDLIENNKFLILPRLSSQGVMDMICPTESSLYRRRLCVVFLTRQNKIIEDEENARLLREYALRPDLPSRVRFAYLYGDKQKDFISTLSGHPKQSNLVVIWRQTNSRMAYEWIDGGWDGTNASNQRLEAILHRLMTDKTSLSYQVDVKELTDEHAQGFLFKVLRKVSLTMEFVRAQVTREMVIQTGSVIATVLFIVAGGFIMAYLVRLEEESILAKAKADAQQSPPSNTSRTNGASTNANRPNPIQVLTQNPECRIHEMRGETYNGLVRLIKPGCRTILLLLDADAKDVLIPKFQRSVWPYRKNKSLQFGYMHVDRLGGLSWYKQLLQLSLTEPKTLNINPRNCVGTVLSLNGHRKYFCVFHATMPTVGSPRRRTSSGYRNGGFLGFDSENSSDEQSDVERGNSLQDGASDTTDGAGILFTNHLLDNLSNWLDRLFEGSTHRYHINYWPEFPLK